MATSSLLVMKSNTQLIEEDRQKAISALPPIQAPAINSLAAFLDKAWEAAKKEKDPIERQIMANMRARNNEYEPEKLAAIRQIGAPEIFMGITEAKTRNAEAWVKDILFQPNNVPWDIEPTPVPELPEDLKQEVVGKFFNEALQQIVAQSVNAGQPINSEVIIGQLQAQVPDLQKQVKALILEKAKERAKEIKEEINDQLVEGAW